MSAAKKKSEGLKPPVKKPTVTSSAVAPLTTPKGAHVNDVCADLNATAVAWVATIRARVTELADELARLDRLLGHPDDQAAAVILRTVLNMSALGALGRAVDAAEGVLDELLTDTVPMEIPDLAGECRYAFEAMKAG